MKGTLEAFLGDREISFTSPDDVTLSFALPGDAKQSIGVCIALTPSGLRTESFFMRAPQENARDVYTMLLSRNARGRLVWFAIDTHGDMYLLGFLPRAAVDEQTLDELLGEIVSTCDQMFTGVVECGFEAYLARDMQWRSKQFSPPPGEG